MTGERRTEERRKCALHELMEARDSHLEEKIDRLVPAQYFFYIVSGMCAIAVLLGGLAYRSVEAKNIEQDRKIESLHVTLKDIHNENLELHGEVLKAVQENGKRLDSLGARK